MLQILLSISVLPHQMISNYLKKEDFSEQKIIWAELARTGNSFTIDKKGLLLGNTGYIITFNEGFENIMNYECLLAFLNSKVMLFYLDMVSMRLDETGWRWLRQYVDKLPVPILPMELQSEIIEVVKDELIHITSDGQNELNSIVNKVNGFDTEEISFLQNFH